MDIGWRVSSAGDFNGDGIDDCMFVCRNIIPTPTGLPHDIFIMTGSESIIVDVDEDNLPPNPKGIELKQNYPNPFNNSTTIIFHLQETTHIKLTIYNALGEVVCLLLNENKSSGIHSIIWDGRDDSGNILASGIYYYELDTMDFRQTRRMVLLR